MFRFNKKGFTLVELLVVIAIIGILASVVIVSLNSARTRARDARRAADFSQIQSALETYYESQNPPIYPNTGWAAMDTALEAGGFMSNVPTDPKNSGTQIYDYDSCAAGGSNNQDYVLSVTMENTSAPALRNSYKGTKCAVNCAALYCVVP